MAELISHLLSVVLPITLCILVGFSLAKLKLPFDRKAVGSLVQNVGYPTLIISHLSAGHVEFSTFLTLFFAALAMVASFFVIASVLLKVLRLRYRAYIGPMSLSNTGNIGLPVATLAFGAEGTSYALAFVVAVLLGIFTYGDWIPRGSVSLRQVLTSPVLYAIAVALLMLGTGATMPGPLADATSILGGMAVPLMLLTLGHSLATLRTGDLGLGVLLALLHLAMSLVVGIGLAYLFGFTGTERGVFILLAVMPPSVATYLFVELYTPEEATRVAGLILIGTCLTVLVLPLVMTYVL